MVNLFRNNLRKKTVILVFLTVLVVLPYLVSSCEAGSANMVFQKAPMCHMESISAVEPHHLSHIRQLTLATVSKNGVENPFILLLLYFLVVAYLYFFSQNVSLLHIKYDKTSHMKPWDPISLALADGIVQRKHLD